MLNYGLSLISRYLQLLRFVGFFGRFNGIYYIAGPCQLQYHENQVFKPTIF